LFLFTFKDASSGDGLLGSVHQSFRTRPKAKNVVLKRILRLGRRAPEKAKKAEINLAPFTPSRPYVAKVPCPPGETGRMEPRTWI
jgi:hypothetical protein